jgi:hypothetical protein
LVYAVAFYFVWMILSFFATSGWETVTFAGRSNLGLAISLFILVAYGLWREKGLAGVPRGADGRPAYLGPQPVADGPEFRRRLLQRRHAQGDGRFFQDHHHADVHHRQRAAVRPCPDVRAHSQTPSPT